MNAIFTFSFGELKTWKYARIEFSQEINCHETRARGSIRLPFPTVCSLIECNFSSRHRVRLKLRGGGGNDFGKQKCRNTFFGGMSIRYIYENPSAHSLEGMWIVLNALLKCVFSVWYEVPEIQICRWAEVWFDEFLTYLTSIDRLWHELYDNFRPKFLSSMRAHCTILEYPL
jgi:hypothetical protein